MNQTNDGESITEFFERRVREAAGEIGAEVDSVTIGTDEMTAILVLRGEFAAFGVSRGGRDAAVIRQYVDRFLPRTVDALCAVTSVEIPPGTVWMALGARRVFGTDEPLPPIAKLNRSRAVYWREGDAEPRPWPSLTFRNDGRQGIVERAP